MKTLDEVINAIEYCITGKSCAHGECPYSEENCVNHGMEKDALHYLLEYREMKEHLACLDAVTLHGDDTTKYRRRKNENA